MPINKTDDPSIRMTALRACRYEVITSFSSSFASGESSAALPLTDFIDAMMPTDRVPVMIASETTFGIGWW